MVRQGLRSVLDTYPNIEVVGEATNGAEAVALADKLRPSVVLMDINMPKMNGIETTTQIKSHYPNMVVVDLASQCRRRKRGGDVAGRSHGPHHQGSDGR
jgi:DNA-binding NarL/FixJ family response regulator